MRDAGRDENVDSLDADERNDDAAQAIDGRLAAQQRSGADRTKRRPSGRAG